LPSRQRRRMPDLLVLVMFRTFWEMSEYFVIFKQSYRVYQRPCRRCTGCRRVNRARLVLVWQCVAVIQHVTWCTERWLRRGSHQVVHIWRIRAARMAVRIHPYLRVTVHRDERLDLATLCQYKIANRSRFRLAERRCSLYENIEDR
jgi:hypothetical protein